VSGRDAGSAPRGPILVELVGPPGAGKSTILEGLLTRDDKIESRPVPSKRSYVGAMGWHLLVVLAMALRHGMLHRCDGGMLRALAYLRALPRILEGWPGTRVIVFDQGPIFLLTRPDVFEERFAPWRARTFATWNALLDVVVVLDAPNAVLIERINTRSKEHRVKGSSFDAAWDFVAQSRVLYDEALAGLGAQGSGPTILRFDTSLCSVTAIVEEIVATLAELCPGWDVRAPSKPP
jgi:hypothetical protein